MSLIFEILRPSSLDEALRLMHEYSPDVKPLAGGTELLILIKDKKIPVPKYLVDLSRLKKELTYVKVENGLVKIGALTTIWELSESLLHRDIRYAGFRDAWSKFGTIALRFNATIGGNIATATDYSDYVVLLMAYNASVKLESTNGSRTVPLENLVVDRRVLNMNKDEVITEIVFPEPPFSSSSAFVKFDRREILIAGIANGCVFLHLREGKIEDTRIVFDTAKEKRIPVRLREIEEYLKGRYLTQDLVEETAEELVPRYVRKFTDWWTTAEYRLEMSKTSFKRAILTAKKRIEAGMYE